MQGPASLDSSEESRKEGREPGWSVPVVVPSNSVFLTSDNKKANCDQLSVVAGWSVNNTEILHY